MPFRNGQFERMFGMMAVDRLQDYLFGFGHPIGMQMNDPTGREGKRQAAPGGHQLRQNGVDLRGFQACFAAQFCGMPRLVSQKINGRGNAFRGDLRAQALQPVDLFDLPPSDHWRRGLPNVSSTKRGEWRLHPQDQGLPPNGHDRLATVQLGKPTLAGGQDPRLQQVDFDPDGLCPDMQAVTASMFHRPRATGHNCQFDGESPCRA